MVATGKGVPNLLSGQRSHKATIPSGQLLKLACDSDDGSVA
jgi:hypothetical protein